MAAMKSTERTEARPPAMKLLPRHSPDCRVKGARPMRLATCRRSSVPSSGTSPSSVRVVMRPTPGTLARRSSFSRQTGELRSMPSISSSTALISFSRALIRRPALADMAVDCPLLALPLGHDHLDNLAAPGDQIRQTLRFFVRKRPDRRFSGLHETGDDFCVDRITLGAPAKRVRKRTHLRRIDNHDRQHRRCQTGCYYPFNTAGRLYSNDGRI